VLRFSVVGANFLAIWEGSVLPVPQSKYVLLNLR
jgi:hypothetical protein